MSAEEIEVERLKSLVKDLELQNTALRSQKPNNNSSSNNNNSNSSTQNSGGSHQPVEPSGCK